MTAWAATTADLDWIIATLTMRREPLAQRAPIFWRPAPDADTHHRAFIDHLMAEGGAKAYRTDAAVLVAAPRRGGWLVDDAYVPATDWIDGDGRDLWNALAVDCDGDQVRLVCPTYEHDRAAFAQAVGLTVEESWWLLELDGSGGGLAGERLPLPGAEAVTVAAPPVYAPPGPVLFLPTPSDADQALPAAKSEAAQRGCAAIVVNQTAVEDALADSLTGAGFRRHCDYYRGTIQRV